MKRLWWLALCAACSADSRGQCVNEYVDHYDYSTSCDSRGVCRQTSSAVYECDVWVRVTDDSVLVTRKVGHNRIVDVVNPERYQ